MTSMYNNSWDRYLKKPTKLESGVFSQIPYKEVRNLVGHCKNIGLTTESIRSRVLRIFHNYQHKQVTSEDFLEIKSDIKIAYNIDFNLPLDEKGKQTNQRNYLKKKHKWFFDQKEEDIKAILEIFNIQGIEDFFLFSKQTYFDKIQNSYSGSFALAKTFINTEEERKQFVKLFEEDRIFSYMIKRLNNQSDIVQKLQKNMNQLEVFVGTGDIGNPSLLNFFDQILRNKHQAKFMLSYLPLFTENGEIDKNHHYFIYPEYMDMWAGEPEKIEYLFEIFDITTADEIVNFYPMLNKTELTGRFMNRYLEIFKNFSQKDKKSKKLVQKLLRNHIFPSTEAENIFCETHDFADIEQMSPIIEFFIKNKQKSFIKFLKDMHSAQELRIETEKLLPKFPEINTDSNLEEIHSHHQEVMQKIGCSNKEKIQFAQAIKHKDLQKIQTLIYEDGIKLFQKNISDAFIQKIQKEFLNNDENITEIEKRISDPLFIEAYKIIARPRYNGEQGRHLIKLYFNGDFDNPEDVKQFNTPRNHEWLKKNLDIDQQKIWLSKNREEITIENREHSDNTDQRLQDHAKIAHEKIAQINSLGFEFSSNFENPQELIALFDVEITKNREEIESKDKSLFADLELQIISIKKLQNQSNQNNNSKSKKIIIEKELNPLRVLMMGNWVEGSCLSFYNSIGNYYSAISNAIDVNKGVFYIYNQNNELLGRVLVTVGSDKKLTRYKMYYTGKTTENLDAIFNEYFKNLAKKMNIEINGVQDNVVNIESDNWYRDGEVFVY